MEREAVIYSRPEVPPLRNSSSFRPGRPRDHPALGAQIRNNHSTGKQRKQRWPVNFNDLQSVLRVAKVTVTRVVVVIVVCCGLAKFKYKAGYK